MDPAQYRSQYPYDAPSRPQYLTPPPPFLSFHESILQDISYDTLYAQFPVMPSPVNPNFRTYTQIPSTPNVSDHYDTPEFR